MKQFVGYLLRMLIFVGLQIYFLNKIPPLHQFISPSLYFLFILWLPINMPAIRVMLWSLVLGSLIDIFMNTLGLHAMVCVATGFLRWTILRILFLRRPSDHELFIEPSPQNMGWALYSIYAAILTFVYHFILVLIEWLTFGNFVFFVLTVLGSTFISLMLITTTEVVYFRNPKK